MDCQSQSRRPILIVVAILVALLATNRSSSTAQEKEKKDTAPAARLHKHRGRLPNFYAKIVTPDQREQIYKVQSRYQSQIEALRKQLREAVAKRNAEIRELLTPEQQKRLDEIVAKARKAARNRRSPKIAPKPKNDQAKP